MSLVLRNHKLFYCPLGSALTSFQYPEVSWDHGAVGVDPDERDGGDAGAAAEQAAAAVGAHEDDAARQPDHRHRRRVHDAQSPPWD